MARLLWRAVLPYVAIASSAGPVDEEEALGPDLAMHLRRLQTELGTVTNHGSGDSATRLSDRLGKLSQSLEGSQGIVPTVAGSPAVLPAPSDGAHFQTLQAKLKGETGEGDSAQRLASRLGKLSENLPRGNLVHSAESSRSSHGSQYTPASKSAVIHAAATSNADAAGAADGLRRLKAKMKPDAEWSDSAAHFASRLGKLSEKLDPEPALKMLNSAPTPMEVAKTGAVHAAVISHPDAAGTADGLRRLQAKMKIDAEQSNSASHFASRLGKLSEQLGSEPDVKMLNSASVLKGVSKSGAVQATEASQADTSDAEDGRHLRRLQAKLRINSAESDSAAHLASRLGRLSETLEDDKRSARGDVRAEPNVKMLNSVPVHVGTPQAQTKVASEGEAHLAANRQGQQPSVLHTPAGEKVRDSDTQKSHMVNSPPLVATNEPRMRNVAAPSDWYAEPSVTAVPQESPRASSAHQVKHVKKTGAAHMPDALKSHMTEAKPILKRAPQEVDGHKPQVEPKDTVHIHAKAESAAYMPNSSETHMKQAHPLLKKQAQEARDHPTRTQLAHPKNATARAETHQQTNSPGVPILQDWDAFRKLVKGSDLLVNEDFLHAGHKIRGLAAVRAMKTGDTILEVPVSLVLSKAHPKIKEFYSGIDFVEPSDPSWKLVCFLAAEKRLGQASPWGAYLSHLPTLDDYKAFHPLWASEELLKEFESLPTLHDVREYRRRARTQWREWRSFAHQLARHTDAAPGKGAASTVTPGSDLVSLRHAALAVTETDIQWAFTTVLTRGFSTAQGSSLAPVADDLNTDVPSRLNVQWHAQPDGSVKLVATASIAKGAELITSYTAHPRSNDDFVTSFGFVMVNNADVAAPLSPADCQTMASNIAKKQFPGGNTGTACAPPKTEKQPGIFCALMALAKEHCPHLAEKGR